MKLLIKFPTRGRPEKSLETLRKYIEYAEDLNTIHVIVSIDEDDTSVTQEMFQIHDCVEVIRGPSVGKIGAINRDMPDPSTFDILLLASDDMIPQVKGYDTILRSKMIEHFPDTDGVLFFNDGYVGYKLNTLVICGSKYYSRFGYIYCPEYKSFFCDNEFSDIANRLGRQFYFDQIIIRHEHPANSINIYKDALYIANQKYWNADKLTYESRRFTDYDVSILICTIPSRRELFIDLINRINLLKQTSTLSIEVVYDNRASIHIGEKRNDLLNACHGKYCAFVDDDDKITDDYFKVIEDSELKYDCIQLNGILYLNGEEVKPFYHSLKYTKWIDETEAYYRNPNHLNPMRTSIAKQIKFPMKDYHEDREFSRKLLESELIKTEYEHDKIQYLYMYVDNKPAFQPVMFNSAKFLKKLFKY